MVMSNASRAINVINAAATLTVGGQIQDGGQVLGLTKTGAGTLVPTPVPLRRNQTGNLLRGVPLLQKDLFARSR